MKKHLFFLQILTIFIPFSCYAAQQTSMNSLKYLCTAIIGKNAKLEATNITKMSPQEARQVLEKEKPFVPSWWMPNIIDHTNLEWQSKEIKQATPIKRDIKKKDGKKILSHQADQKFRKEMQNAEIRGMAIGSKQIHGERPLYVTQRDGRTNIFTLESGKFIASFLSPKPKLPNPIAPIKDNFTWANNKYQAQTINTRVQILCNNKQIGDITLPTTRGGKAICASSLKLDLYKRKPHLFIGTDNGKLLRVTIDGTKLGKLLTLMRGPRKDSGHKKPIRDIFVTPNKQHINTTSIDSLRSGPITPSSKKPVITKLNFGKHHIIKTSSSTGDIISGGNNQYLTIQSKNLQKSQSGKIDGTTTAILTSPLGKHAIIGTQNGTVHLITHPHEQAKSLQDLKTALVMQETKKQIQRSSPNSKKRLRTIKKIVKENQKKKQKTK